MDGRHAQALQTRQMLGGRIALVPGQAVAGVERVQLHQEPVPRDLGHDGGSGNRRAEGIPLDHWRLAAREIGQRPGAIDQHPVRRHGQGRHRFLHGSQGRLQNVDLVDDGRVDLADPHGHRLPVDLRQQRFPLRWG